jgi:hypothetical protein
MSTYAPQGYTDIAPWVVTDDTGAFQDFVMAAFGGLGTHQPPELLAAGRTDQIRSAAMATPDLATTTSPPCTATKGEED